MIRTVTFVEPVGHEIKFKDQKFPSQRRVEKKIILYGEMRKTSKRKMEN